MKANNLGIQNLLNILTESKTPNKNHKTINSRSTLVSFKNELDSLLITKTTPEVQKNIKPVDKNKDLEKLMQESELLSYLNLFLCFDNPKIKIEASEDSTYLKIFNNDKKKTVTFDLKELMNNFDYFLKLKQNQTNPNAQNEVFAIKQALNIIHNILKDIELTKDDAQTLLKAIDITTKNVIKEVQKSITDTGYITPEQKKYFESMGIKIDIMSVQSTNEEIVNLITLQKGKETIIIPENQAIDDENILNNSVLIKLTNNDKSYIDNINNPSEFIYSDNNYTPLTNIKPDIISEETFNTTLINSSELEKIIVFQPKTESNSNNTYINSILSLLEENENKSENSEKYEKSITFEKFFFSTDNENNIVNNNKNSASQNNYTNNFNDNQNKTYFDIQKERKQNYLSIEDLKNDLQTKKLNLTEQENSEILQASIHSSESNTNTSYDIASNYINIDNQTNNQFESLTNIHQKNNFLSFLNTDDLNTQIKDVIITKNTEQFFNESFSVNVSPPNLGKVDIQIIKNGEAITINLATESENAKLTLSKTVQSLVGNLRDEGYNPVDVKIFVHQEESEPDYQHQQNQNQKQHEEKRYKQKEKDENPIYTFEEFLRSDLHV